MGHAQDKGYIEWFVQQTDIFLKEEKLNNFPVFIGLDFNTNMKKGKGKQLVGYKMVFPTFMMNAYDTFGLTIGERGERVSGQLICLLSIISDLHTAWEESQFEINMLPVVKSFEEA